MQSMTDPTKMLGRQTQVDTSTGSIRGTVLAVGAKGVSIAVERQVVRVHPSQILGIHTDHH